MILLDTNALIKWVAAPEKLSKKAREIIEERSQKEQILVSSISVWEISLLIKKGRVEFSIDSDTWLEEMEGLHMIKFIPVDNQIAYKSVNLENFHQDPADRMIVATAQITGATIITSDQKIRKYPEVQTVW